MGLGKTPEAQLERLSRATSLLVRSHFAAGYAELARVKASIGSAPWAAKIQGEYSGDMLRMSDADLRRIGRARFDNLEVIWDYDAVAALKQLRVPLLWVLAGEDREAPIAQTRKALATLAKSGLRLDSYLFPDTDHGIVEFQTNQDGTRRPTRIADGYLRLLADWIKGESAGPYGKSVKLP
jgi:pimeloyl-ACP methyl ester carboxylesterase